MRILNVIDVCLFMCIYVVQKMREKKNETGIAFTIIN